MDSYTEERRTQATESILASVQLGRVICVTDPTAAEERDATVLANRRGRPPTRPEPAKALSCGLLHRRPGAETAEPPAGVVVPQGRVRRHGVTGLFDDVVGRGFVLLTTADPRTALEADRLAFLRDLGAHVVRLVSPTTSSAATDDVVDVDDVYRPFLARFMATALLVRPDYHVFGASDLDGTAALVDDLRDQLRVPVRTG